MRKVTAVGSAGAAGAAGAAGRQGGLRAIKTASSICIRSTKPPVQGQQYLDLYVLQRDRARWQQLKDRADEMIGCIDKALTRLGLASASLGRRVKPADRQARRQTIVVGSPSRQQSSPASPSSQPSAGRSEKVA